MNLQDILGTYGVPDKSIVGKLPRGGITLDFVGHAEITKILIEIDPNWSWEPVAWTTDGRPAINVVNGNAVMWGRLTVLGQTRLGVGTAKHDKADLDKELIGDFLRNAAMRFGICLSLWSKAEWDDQPEAQSPGATVAKGPDRRDIEQAVTSFKAACSQNSINPEEFATGVGISNLSTITPEELDKLRKAYREHMKYKPEAEHKPDTEAVAPARDHKILVAEATALAMGKKFNKQDRLEMASDIAKRPITDLKQLTAEQLAEFVSLVEGARA